MNILVRCWHVGQPSNIHAIRGMLDSVRLVAAQYHPSLILFAHEGGHGHRHAIYPQYKATRPETDPNLKAQVTTCLKALDFIGWPVLSSPGFEADDVLATLATDLATRADEVVLVTSDKDLLGFVGRDGVTVHDPAKKVRVTREHVRERLGIDPHQVSDFLTLQGDTSDNIPGGAGIGAKTAAELLSVVGSLKAILQLAANPTAGHPQAKALAKVQRSRADIELSQQLVTLVTDTPLPSRWWLWPADQPRAHWQLRLQELGLGEPARRLADSGLFNETRSRHVPLLPPIIKERENVNTGGSDHTRTREAERFDSLSGMPAENLCPTIRSERLVQRDESTVPIQPGRSEDEAAANVPTEQRGIDCNSPTTAYRDPLRVTSGTEEVRGPSGEAGSAALDDTQPTGRTRRELDRLSLPAWLCDAATFEPIGYTEDISRADLLRKYQQGLDWRASEQSAAIVAAINTADAVTYCRKIWDATPTASQLAWCRGALGQPFEDFLAVPAKASAEPTRRVSTPSLF